MGPEWRFMITQPGAPPRARPGCLLPPARGPGVSGPPPPPAGLLLLSPRGPHEGHCRTDVRAWGVPAVRTARRGRGQRPVSWVSERRAQCGADTGAGGAAAQVFSEKRGRARARGPGGAATRTS